MARNMKMELHTFSLILYQSKKCGHRIHVLFMMYDVYWYCKMKKKRMIMKILKKEWFIWKFWKKGGVVEKRGEEETKSMPHAPVEHTAGNRHKQNSWFCKEIREDNFRFWWRRVHEDASQGMYMSKIEIFFFTARKLQNQRMLCCGECFHD